jgi:hypothetical protein
MRSKASRCASLAAGEFVTTLIPSETVVAHALTRLAVNFDHAGIARLDWAKLRVITNLRHFAAAAVDDVDKALISFCFLNQTVNCYSEHPYAE